MGFYRKFILPHLINLSMSNRECARYRSQLIPLAYGEVVEIGVGSGLNLPFYTKEARNVLAVEPSNELLRMAQKMAASATPTVELVNSSAEELPFESNTADTVVMTWTLCSIPEPQKALAEILRVLKPGGELLFIEHGAPPDSRVRTWQDRINSPWRALAGGCNLNRPIDTLISSAGFHILQLEKSYLRGPRVFTFTYRGRAQKQ